MIRSARTTDVDDVVRIYVASWNRGFGSRMPEISADADRIRRWSEDLARPAPHRWWVAEREDRVVGFVGIRPSRDPVDPALGELDTIAVDPSEWRRSVGSRLMETALRWLRADGYRSAILWTLDDYPRGAGFYASTGWRRSRDTRRDGTQVRYDHELRHGTDGDEAAGFQGLNGTRS